jgi:hypothetical protein
MYAPETSCASTAPLASKPTAAITHLIASLLESIEICLVPTHNNRSSRSKS